VAGAPPGLTLSTHRDTRNWWQSVWIRRALLLVPIALIVAGLGNAFGQRPSTTSAASPRADLTIYAPIRARSGLIYAARFRIDAIRELKDARLILDPGWAEGYTVNGQIPQALTQASDDGKIELGLGHIAAGRHLTFWLSLQVNPTNVGRHRQSVVLYDGDTRLTTVHRSITIFP
jgi:hypothetical protein